MRFCGRSRTRLRLRAHIQALPPRRSEMSLPPELFSEIHRLHQSEGLESVNVDLDLDAFTATWAEAENRSQVPIRVLHLHPGITSVCRMKLTIDARVGLSLDLRLKSHHREQKTNQ
jgi:hypothetical protein